MIVWNLACSEFGKNLDFGTDRGYPLSSQGVSQADLSYDPSAVRIGTLCRGQGCARACRAAYPGRGILMPGRGPRLGQCRIQATERGLRAPVPLHEDRGDVE